jgi:protein SCO1
VLDLLGPDADRLMPLYISVDPDRDSPEVMRAFLQASYPRFTGLTGDKAEIDDVRTKFKVFAGRRPDPDDPEGYEVPHSAFVYLVTPEGDLIGHYADHLTAEKIAEKIGAFLTK